jgi:uncharacterized protein (DUF1697 family)
VKYVALLRGIKVGGNNVIRMDALRAAFEELGFENVSTFIASGNVLFEAKRASKATLTETIERALSEAFGYDSKIVVVSGDDLATVIAEAPPGFGSDPETYRYDVIFVKRPATAEAALAEVETAPGVDEVRAGTNALYFWRVAKLASRSRLSKIIGKPVYKSLTIRNWNTTKRLAELIGQ